MIDRTPRRHSTMPVPPTRRRASAAAAPQIVRRAQDRRGRRARAARRRRRPHGDEPHRQRQRRSKPTPREHAKLYVKTAFAEGAATPARRWPCPARCRARAVADRGARERLPASAGHKDIGSRVEKGELLAEIETPEIDQQLSQAVAARQQAASSLALAKSTVERWEALRKKDVVSQQELDERRSAAAQATRQPRRRRRQRRAAAPARGLQARRRARSPA